MLTCSGVYNSIAEEDNLDDNDLFVQFRRGGKQGSRGGARRCGNDNDNILIPHELEPDGQVGNKFVEWKWGKVNENQINSEEFPFSDLEGLKMFLRMKNQPSRFCQA